MRQSISLIILSFLLLTSLLFGQGNLVLYRWDTGAKVYVWKAFGDSDINPKYEGEIKNGKPDGFGILTYIDLVSCRPVCGKKYVGEFKDGLRHGQGTHTWSEGSMYVGEYKDGKRNGQGTMTYSSGNRYVGEWKDGKRNGQGIHTWSEGDKYVGEFKDGMRNGQGTYTFSDGKKYVGEWKDGKRSNGTTYDNKGNMIAKFVNGVKRYLTHLTKPIITESTSH